MLGASSRSRARLARAALYIVPALHSFRLGTAPSRATATQVRAGAQETAQEVLIDDRETISRGDPVVLIVEDISGLPRSF